MLRYSFHLAPLVHPCRPRFLPNPEILGNHANHAAATTYQHRITGDGNKPDSNGVHTCYVRNVTSITKPFIDFCFFIGRKIMLVERERERENITRWIIYVTNKHYPPPPRNVINLFLRFYIRKKHMFDRKIEERPDNRSELRIHVPFPRPHSIHRIEAFGSVPVHKHSTIPFLRDSVLIYPMAGSTYRGRIRINSGGTRNAR